MSDVGALVLAAGGGRRFGGPKALVELEGSSLLERAVAVAVDAGCDPVVAVLGAEVSRAEGQAKRTGAETVRNPGWEQGMGSSLRTGLAALSGRCDAVVVLLVDQPGITTTAVRRLVERWREDRPDAVTATFAGAQRPPTVLDAAVWDEVATSAEGDVGAREWLRSNPDQVVPVPCDDVADPHDVDTPEDLAFLR